MHQTSVDQVIKVTIESVGLDPEYYDISSIEVMAGIIRRVCGQSCPVSKAHISRTVINITDGLELENEEIKDLVNNTIDNLIAYGDLLEAEEVVIADTNAISTLLYTAPPSFVHWKSGKILLLGIAPDNNVLDAEISEMIEYDNHVRVIMNDEHGSIKEKLTRQGLLEQSSEYWLRQPKLVTYKEHLDDVLKKLNKSGPSGEIDGIKIIDKDKTVKFYKGRWSSPKDENGIYVCRWPRLYGSNLWGVVELENGVPQKLLHLPIKHGKTRACDEAWRIQSALDVANGSPQRYRLRETINGDSVIDIFSPLPNWITRRWDITGRSVSAYRSLFSYQFKKEIFADEIDFIEKMMWLKCESEE